MIRAENVTMQYPVPKRYREYLLRPFRKPDGCVALDNVTFEVEKGDCLGLLGANGAGKTTLLKLLGGLIYPTQGSIHINGYDTKKHNLEARQSVGYVLNEDRSFYWRLTAIENLEFFGTLDNLWGEGLRKRIAELMTLVGLKDAGEKRVSDYSSGMRQRLAIARGLLSDPEVLLLDEPTKSLDPIGAQEIRDLISKEIGSKQRKTLVIATHQLAEAEALCNRVCVMSAGQVMAIKEIQQSLVPKGDLWHFFRDTLRQEAVAAGS